MRWEVLIVFCSLGMGLMLPTLLKKQYDWDPTMTKDGGNGPGTALEQLPQGSNAKMQYDPALGMTLNKAGTLPPQSVQP